MNILNLLKNDQYQIKKLSKGTALYHENDICKSIGIIISGKIKIVTYLANGNEIIYNQLVENEIFGNNLIFSSNPHYKGDIVALVDSQIAIINKKQLLQILMNNQEFLIHYLEIQSNFGKTLNNKIKLLSINNAEERLYYYFHINNKEIYFDSVQDLAKQLYLTREATSRLLSRLAKENKIIRKNKSIRLI